MKVTSWPIYALICTFFTVSINPILGDEHSHHVSYLYLTPFIFALTQQLNQLELISLLS